MIQLSNSRVATVFINPPVIVQPTGSFARMSSTKIERTNITALIDDMGSGIGVEAERIDLKAFFACEPAELLKVMSDDIECLKNFAHYLLLEFGVDLKKII